MILSHSSLKFHLPILDITISFNSLLKDFPIFRVSIEMMGDIYFEKFSLVGYPSISRRAWLQSKNLPSFELMKRPCLTLSKRFLSFSSSLSDPFRIFSVLWCHGYKHRSWPHRYLTWPKQYTPQHPWFDPEGPRWSSRYRVSRRYLPLGWPSLKKFFILFTITVKKFLPINPPWKSQWFQRPFDWQNDLESLIKNHDPIISHLRNLLKLLVTSCILRSILSSQYIFEIGVTFPGSSGFFANAIQISASLTSSLEVSSWASVQVFSP